MILLGCASGLAQQIPVSAMSQIQNEEQKEIAHSPTLVTALRAISAPTRVALLSGIVQTQSQHYTTSLTAQRITGELLRLQSSLLAMHESFLVAFCLAILALTAMYFVPGRKKDKKVHIESSLMGQIPEWEH